MWLVGSLKLILTYSSTPRLQNFGRGEEWAFASQKYWNMSVRTIHLSCFYFKRFILENNWSEMTDIMYTHHTTPHRNHTHVVWYHLTPCHTASHTYNLDFSTDYYGAHPSLFMFEFGPHQVFHVCCYVISY